MENKEKKTIKKIKLNKKTKSQIFSTDNTKLNNIKLVKSYNIKKHRPTSALVNQNMNNFAHLFKNNNSNIDILWTLNLRNSEYNKDNNNDSYKKNRQLMNHIREPSFYQEDLDKYVRKKMKKSKSAFEVNLPTLNKYSYLFKNRISETHGTILNNKNLINFELTLRGTDFMKNKKNENENKNRYKDPKEIKKNKKNDWNNSIYKDKKKEMYTVNYNNNTASEKMKNYWIKEKLVMRPYKVILQKIKYDDNSTLIRRKYIKDKEKAFDKLGEAYSFKPYNDKYYEKNYNNIENLLNGNNKSQQNIWFQLSLRDNTKKFLNHKYK